MSGTRSGVIFAWMALFSLYWKRPVRDKTTLAFLRPSSLSRDGTCPLWESDLCLVWEEMVFYRVEENSSLILFFCFEKKKNATNSRNMTRKKNRRLFLTVKESSHWKIGFPKDSSGFESKKPLSPRNSNEYNYYYLLLLYDISTLTQKNKKIKNRLVLGKRSWTYNHGCNANPVMSHLTACASLQWGD